MIKKCWHLILLTSLLLIASCGGAGSSVDTSTSLTGEWRGTGSIVGSGTPLTLQATFIESDVSATNSSFSGNIRLARAGVVCIIVFSGGTLDINNNTIIIPNQDGVSLNGFFDKTVISGSMVSITPITNTPPGCGIFRADIVLNRI